MDEKYDVLSVTWPHGGGGVGCQPAQGWLSGPNGRGRGLRYDLDGPHSVFLLWERLTEFRTIKQALTTVTKANRALKPHP